MEEEVVNASEEAVMMASTTAPGQQLGEAVTSVTQNASTFFHWIKTFITWENLFISWMPMRIWKKTGKTSNIIFCHMLRAVRNMRYTVSSF